MKPNKPYARSQVSRAVKEGRLDKPKLCSKCGDNQRRIEGHHPDYWKPLEVIWLCVPCHVNIHHPNGVAYTYVSTSLRSDYRAKLRLLADKLGLSQMKTLHTIIDNASEAQRKDN